MNSPHYTILLYYKYVDIAEPHKLMAAQRAILERLGAKGRIIVGTEGINGTFEATTENCEKYIEYMRNDPEARSFADFSDIHFKKSTGTQDGTAFPRLSVKVRKELVSAHLDEQDVDPKKVTGKRLKPEDLHAWYEAGKDFTIIDMRNGYEHIVGQFEGSVLPKLSNFRDLPKAVDEEFVPAGLHKKTVLTVCTGGVRCEKASGYLVSRGFEDVYQLDGGIVSYMEKYPGKDFLGSLYVFDKRKVMNFDEKAPSKHTIIGTCAHCKKPSERYVNCMNQSCHKHCIVCEVCAPDENAATCTTC
ncbi:MAG: hypothetical protein RIT04_17 [Candidatus Parcubacteria bacterium]|jgi:UPF0176 protein